MRPLCERLQGRKSTCAAQERNPENQRYVSHDMPCQPWTRAPGPRSSAVLLRALPGTLPLPPHHSRQRLFSSLISNLTNTQATPQRTFYYPLHCQPALTPPPPRKKLDRHLRCASKCHESSRAPYSIVLVRSGHLFSENQFLNSTQFHHGAPCSVSDYLY